MKQVADYNNCTRQAVYETPALEVLGTLWVMKAEIELNKLESK